MDRDGVRSLFDLTGRVAIITGGTRGIGRAIAGGFAAAGANVAVASRKADACERTEAELRSTGAAAIGIPAHMGNPDDVKRIVECTMAEFGRIDIVVNNAANALTQPMGHFTEEAWDKSYAVNLRGPVFLVQHALPHLTASPHPSVINVLTVGAFIFSGGMAMYTAAKAAMMSYTRSMAAEFAPRGIRVNALAPGTTDTDMVHTMSPESQKRAAEMNLMKRMADPSEMIGPALFLASDASSFVTGQVLIADGGYVAR
jgi:NAD(P)-dependent dehydrogenase (short-subunit alcohol dehydrogenase family)